MTRMELPSAEDKDPVRVYVTRASVEEMLR